MASIPSDLPTAFCFSGQGSQYFHMAAGMMQSQPVFRQWMEIGDAIVHRAEGFSPLAIIYDKARGKHEAFDQLEHSHPALFMVQFALAKQVQALGLRPDLLLGMSLGEFVAMSVAGMIPFETALLVIARQPRVFDSTVAPGALIALLASPAEIAAVPGIEKIAEIVGVNGARHCVLACLEAARADVTAALDRAKIAHQRLPVPFAFHSRWIEGAKDRYLASVADLRLETPFWPAWSSRLAAPVHRADPAHLWQIVRGPMRLRETVAAIEAQGGAHYIDLSPTGTIAAILGQDATKGPSRRTALLSPFGKDSARLDSLMALT
ncbi:acyltransferase domain-containing protein [Oceaniovalibus sp. ACAM 378]|uniref:acyltransferase domain-containing protein n=1 Tax=Oceaniovalibus sp. ACAM 378 TaxID=2599923 RepID=UPI0016523F70|nr:acyltransferase domain-containing protein [Oceaniovalibus sp. ACAM 378]